MPCACIRIARRSAYVDARTACMHDIPRVPLSVNAEREGGLGPRLTVLALQIRVLALRGFRWR